MSDGSRYGLAALEAECSLVAAAPEGERNTQFNTSAFRLYQLVAGEELTEEVTRGALEQAAAAAGLEAGEVADTLASAEKGKAFPRSRPTS